MTTQQSTQSKTKDLERIKVVVREFLSKYQYLYEKRIQKLVFYGEIYCLINFGSRLTNANFKPYMYGSFSEDIREALAELDNEGVQTEEVLINGKWVTKYIGEEVDGGNLPAPLAAIVDAVHQQTRSQSTEELAKFSKQNWLFEQTDYGDLMDFDEFAEKLDNDIDTTRYSDLDVGVEDDELIKKFRNALKNEISNSS
jgi:uncharacterized protein YwgA